MQIIIPMSGLGNRFLKAGYKVPKPLIKVDGKPMIEHVVSLFPGEEDFLFVCNNSHLEESEMGEILKRIAPKGRVFGVDRHEAFGPVYDIVLAEKEIKDDEPVIVNYCDFNQSWDYADFKKQMEESGCDGAVICYTGFHPHLLGDDFYAGCKVDKGLNLTEIREKYSFTENKMDSHHSSGTYYFRSGAILKKYFKLLMDEKMAVNGEYYASVPYKLMLEDGLKVLVYEVDYFCQWGTPQDLQEYEYWSDYFINYAN